MKRAVPRAPSGALAALTICFTYALLAVVAGKDVNWDLLNYHLYNGYAFLTGRLDVDLAPGQLETFLNPLLDAPLYLAVMHLPPVLVGAGTGFVQGLNGVAIWLMARELLPKPLGPKRDWAAFAIGIVSGLGAAGLGELGGCMGDAVAGIFVLFSMVLLLRRRESLGGGSSKVAAASAALAGAIAGVGPGLKLTALLYVAAVGVGCFFLAGTAKRRLLVFLCFGVSAFASWIAVSGFWLWELWTRFQSPLFPFFNNVFRSDWAPVDLVRETRYLPKSAGQALFYPFVWLVDESVVSEHPFRDGRLPAAYLASGLLVVRSLVRRFTGKTPKFSLPSGPVPFFTVASFSAYAFWMLMFGVYRYLGSIDWLTTLALTLALLELLPSRGRTGAIAGILAFLVITTKPHFYGRGGWSKHYFDVTTPELSGPAPRMVVIADLEPVGFLIPYFPPDIRFVRLRGRPLGGVQTDRFEGVVEHLIRSHRGSLFVLYPGPEVDAESRTVLRQLGFGATGEGCGAIGVGRPSQPPYAAIRPHYVTRALVPPLHVCPLVRIDS
jgi:hypothetical protein